MLKDGADLKSVSEIAGHSRPGTTTNVYQHVDETMHRAAIEKIPPLKIKKAGKDSLTSPVSVSWWR